MTFKKYERDKEAKIQRIIHSTKTLVENNGYNAVSIRDIAKEADVSIGLIYKYFPNGKFDILKQLSFKHMNNDFMINQPEKINFADFPGYMRNVTKSMIEIHRKNAKLIKAFTVAALIEDKVLEDIKSIDAEDYLNISEFFSEFDGVDISDKDHVNLFTEWSLTIKSMIFYSTMFPAIFKDDESLIDLLVDISIKIWNYNP